MQKIDDEFIKNPVEAYKRLKRENKKLKKKIEDFAPNLIIDMPKIDIFRDMEFRAERAELYWEQLAIAAKSMKKDFRKKIDKLENKLEKIKDLLQNLDDTSEFVQTETYKRIMEELGE